MWERVVALFSTFLVFFSAYQQLTGSMIFYGDITDERVFDQTVNNLNISFPSSPAKKLDIPFQAHNYKMTNTTNLIMLED